MNNQMEQNMDLICPTFTSYTADTTAETASRVAKESYLEDDDKDFEFAKAHDNDNEPIEQVPVREFTQMDLFNENHADEDNNADDSISSTSADDDSGDDMKPVTIRYCVWRPRSPGRCKKSKSAGSGSKRWKLLDLLRRSNSDGKGDFVFLGLHHRDSDHKSKMEEGKGEIVFSSNRAVKDKPKGSAVEEFYVQNRASKEGQKRKSYLPYKKDLVGFFSNVKGIRKS